MLVSDFVKSTGQIVVSSNGTVSTDTSPTWLVISLQLLGATQNYRPISNRATVSKVIERLVLTRLRPHLLDSTNFSEFQSAYWKGYSMESASLDPR